LANGLAVRPRLPRSPGLLHLALVQYSATLNADWLPDNTALLDLDRRRVCTACGLIGADVRPDWTPMTGSAGMDGAHRQ
jgi:hypothetical protein